MPDKYAFSTPVVKSFKRFDNTQYQSGFTLIEILVWIAIAGIVISFVTLSVGSGSRSDQLKADAEKLAGMIQLAVEESVLTSRPMGLRFVQEYGERDTEVYYEWSYYDFGEWQPIDNHSYFTRQRITAGTEIELRFEGRAAELASGLTNNKPDPQEANDRDDQGSESLTSKKITYKPDVFFLHSGEITPAFEIELRSESISEQFQVAGNPVGQIALRRRNNNSTEWL